MNRRARPTSARTAREFVPFSAYLTFSRSGEAGAEDLVISVYCQREDGGIMLRSDISNADGYLLATGPEIQVKDLPGVDTFLPDEALVWLDEVIDFIESSSGLVCARLQEPDVM